MSSMHKALSLSRVWWVLACVMVALILFLSLTPTPPKLSVDISDKWQHAFAYALLMSWFAQLTLRRGRVALLLVVMGVGVEFLQGWSGLRYYEEMDMLANTVGVFIGWLMYILRLRYLLWIEKALT